MHDSITWLGTDVHKEKIVSHFPEASPVRKYTLSVQGPVRSRRMQARGFVLIGMADFVRKNSSRFGDPLRGGPCGERPRPDVREGPRGKVTDPQPDSTMRHIV